jgi:hypothetical protein
MVLPEKDGPIQLQSGASCHFLFSSISLHVFVNMASYQSASADHLALVTADLAAYNRFRAGAFSGLCMVAYQTATAAPALPSGGTIVFDSNLKVP